MWRRTELTLRLILCSYTHAWSISPVTEQEVDDKCGLFCWRVVGSRSDRRRCKRLQSPPSTADTSTPRSDSGRPALLTSDRTTSSTPSSSRGSTLWLLVFLCNSRWIYCQSLMVKPCSVPEMMQMRCSQSAACRARPGETWSRAGTVSVLLGLRGSQHSEGVVLR